MKLPNAPLVEAVFELWWDVVETSPRAIPQFGFDPGFFGLVNKMDDALRGQGFTQQELMVAAGPQSVHNVIKRYRPENSPFPLVQLGHGLLATNVSTEYEWPAFRSQIVTAVRTCIESYPSIEGWSLSPTRAELRYIDVFNEQLFPDSSNLFRSAISSSLNFVVDIPYLDSNIFDPSEDGHLVITKRLKGDSSTSVTIDMGSGRVDEGRGLLLTSKVVRDAGMSEWASDGLVALENWLDQAHTITSDLFRMSVRSELMSKFSE